MIKEYVPSYYKWSENPVPIAHYKRPSNMDDVESQMKDLHIHKRRAKNLALVSIGDIHMGSATHR